MQFSNTTYRSMTDNSPGKTLYMGNVPYELTDQDLQDLFDDISGVTDVRIPVDRRTGLPRGFGHVDFVDVNSASRAKEVLARKAPYGRKLRVTFAKGKALTPEDHQRREQRKLEKKSFYNNRQSARDDVESEQASNHTETEQVSNHTETEQKQ